MELQSKRQQRKCLLFSGDIAKFDRLKKDRHIWTMSPKDGIKFIKCLLDKYHKM